MSNATTPPAAAAAAASTTSTAAHNDAEEAELRTQLRASMKSLSRREPLDLTYKHLLFDGVVTPRQPTLPKDKLYKKCGANLRETVTKFTEHPWDKIAQREPLEEEKMRAAFTLREHKQHEQEALLAATLQARQARNYSSQKRKLEGMAMALQHKRPKPKKKHDNTSSAADTSSSIEEEARKLQAERQRQLKLQQQQRKREETQRRRIEEERRQEEERLARLQESPQRKLARCCQPIFQTLWDMEFPLLQNTNPFRIVIDKNNCAAMGAPDYMNIIDKPMNLSYIQEKLQSAKYEALTEFHDDVELMLKNALTYNSDPNNPYHLAAKEMRKVYRKQAKELYHELQKMPQT